MKYHVNNNGEAGLCSATKGKCPFGSAAEHFTSADAARSAFEKTQDGGLASSKKIDAKPLTENIVEVTAAQKKLARELANYTLETKFGDNDFLHSMVSNEGMKALVFDTTKQKIVRRFRDGEDAWHRAHRYAELYVFKIAIDAIFEDDEQNETSN